MGSRLMLRPAVGMHQMTAVPHVVALGVCEALPHAGIAWPHDLVDAHTGAPLSSVRVRAGYDEGLYAEVELDLDLAEDELAAVEACVAAWEVALAGRAGMAPLAPVLAAYADQLWNLGSEVVVTYPNGRVRARGTFAGIDVWGRATVRTADGTELEFPPEQYRISR